MINFEGGRHKLLVTRMEDQVTDVASSGKDQHPDPAIELLRESEIAALMLITKVRFFLMAVMLPMVWLLGFSSFDRIVTFAVFVVYTIVACVLAYQIKKRRHLKVVGLVGVAIDITLVGLLPLIWYTSLGGSELPFGFTLKTSVTVIALLLIALNSLAMQPAYPMLLTVGSLLVHFALLAGSLVDPETVFTQNYVTAYTTSEVSSGRVVTRFLAVALVGMILTLLTVRARKMVIEAAELQKKNTQLGRYFSANLVRKLSENPALLQVGGERKDLSFVITDLEGFTSLVESSPPDIVVPMINDYLDNLVQIAFKHGGTVDKIVGDSVIVMFGAPVNQIDHPQRAIACAKDMDAAAEHFRTERTSRATIGVTRIGVNSGFAMVGNFGSDAFFDYTAYGDAINTTARLEGANKYLGTRICVSAATATRVPDFQGRPVGKLWLKGKSEGTEVFQPLFNAGEEMSTLPDYIFAYELLRKQLPDALTEFAKLSERYPEDALARFHLTRLQAGRTGIQIVFPDK